MEPARSARDSSRGCFCTLLEKFCERDGLCCPSSPLGCRFSSARYLDLSPKGRPPTPPRKDFLGPTILASPRSSAVQIGHLGRSSGLERPRNSSRCFSFSFDPPKTLLLHCAHACNQRARLELAVIRINHLQAPIEFEEQQYPRFAISFDPRR